MERSSRRRPPLVGTRGGVILALLVCGGWAYWFLELELAGLVPHGGGLEIARDFFARAFSPAIVSEAAFVPEGAPPLLVRALLAGLDTVVFAAAAMSLAVGIGLVLGFFASTAWWAGDPAGGRGPVLAALRRIVGPLVYLPARVLIAGMRSVHEILWAVLFLAAFGLTDAAALLAIAIPYGGTLAKIFSEMVDEVPRDAAHALRGAGARPLQVYSFGLVARALPDMAAYGFYRFECALRSAAVLGFFGFETIGLYLRQSFKSLNYGEVWTYLYTLIALVLVFDWWSGAMRRRVAGDVVQSQRATATAALGASWRDRPRSGFVRISLWLLAALVVYSWLAGGFGFAELFAERRAENARRFLEGIRPYPLQGEAWDWGAAFRWAGDLLTERGWQAMAATTAISVLAILLAAAGGAAACLPAARNLATAEPFAASGRAVTGGQKMFWSTVVASTRVLLAVVRSLPEYVWAFLLLAMLGPTAWPAVLALALHNAGILGRLNAETIENAEARPLQALRAAGARRLQIVAVGVVPSVLPRLLLYFFYRWETCVREATVLGMLGVVSLGYWIADARTRMQHDTFVLFVLLGALIVLAGDLVSAAARRLVREA